MCDLESRLRRTKDNVEEIQSCMKSWASPVFERREGRKDTLLSLEDRAERLDRFYGLVRSSGEKIHFLLKVADSLVLSSGYVKPLTDLVMLCGYRKDSM